jgi:glycerol-3-phosphate dehydrogenase
MPPSASQVSNSPQDAARECDLLIVGGGDQRRGHRARCRGRGAWSLRAAVRARRPGRSHTSSASTKLIHGGLRYLEHYEFATGAQGADRARSGCWRIAPHIMCADCAS